MAKSSIKYIDIDSLNYGKKYGSESSVVYGRFPKRIKVTQGADMFNKFLSSVLICLVMLSLVSYYFVSDSQKKMNALGHEIVSLNNENIELQNKLDNLHSFNKVDEIIQGKTTLNSAKKVIEVPAVYVSEKPGKKKSNIPMNYNWSIGY